jgi:endoglucanase
MKTLKATLIILFIMTSFLLTSQDIVKQNGQLSVKGNKIVNKDGKPVQFIGMSMFWSQWSKFYNENVVNTLATEWKCTIIRAALGIAKDGYLNNPEKEYSKITTVVDACIKNDIYVIIDWHDHNAHNHTDEAVAFFEKIAEKYNQYPNIIYEIYNEPLKVSWANDVKPYAEKVIASIRKYDSKNLIVVGTTSWAQDIDIAADNPITGFDNIVYSVHFYAATHKSELIRRTQYALDKNIAVMVTEWGTCVHTGDGIIDRESVKIWSDFMDKNKISWCNWSVFDKKETASVFVHRTKPDGKWTDKNLTESGKLVKGMILERNSKKD